MGQATNVSFVNKWENHACSNAFGQKSFLGDLEEMGI